MLNRKNFPGLDGFIWWTGVVENRIDPLKLGRVQVRVYGWHTENKALIPTEELHWAQPIFPSNNSNVTYTCKEGDTVFGFFMDGDSAQYPFIFGRMPDIPIIKYPASIGFSDPGNEEIMKTRPVEIESRSMVDGQGIEFTNKEPVRYPDPLEEATTSRFARHENLANTPLPFITSQLKTVECVEGESWDEMPPDYDTEYPYNDSKQSESGHYVDVDDTRNHERICLTHRTGTMMEMANSGSIHIKTMKDSYVVVHGKVYEDYRGRVKKTGEKKTGLRNKGKVVIEINNDLEIHVAGKVTIHSQEDMKIVSDGVLHLSAQLGMTLNTLKDITINANKLKVKAILESNTPVGRTVPNPLHLEERKIPKYGEDGN
jgi:hypothetical protein